MSFCNSLTFFRIRTSAKTQPMSNDMRYILSISMCMQNFNTIFHSVQEITSSSLFQNWKLGKASTNEKCYFAISWARSCQYQCLRNSLSKYSTQFKSLCRFHFFQNLALTKLRPMINVILQFLEQDHVNINVSAKFYQNILNGLRVKFYCFQNLNLGKTSTDPKCHLTISWATSCQYQCVCKISSQWYTEFNHYHYFRIWLGIASTDEKCHFAFSWARSC